MLIPGYGLSDRKRFQRPEIAPSLIPFWRQCVHLHFLIKGTFGWGAVGVAVLQPETGVQGSLNDISQYTHRVPQHHVLQCL